jgi:POLQ-like helicase
MKPDVQSISLLGVTRSKAKMYEYGVPELDHINIVRDPSALMRLTIGILGDYSAQQQSKQNGTENDDLRKNVLFSAQFFDSYIGSRLNSELDPYLLLIGSASYYLCDLPGSASVLLKQISNEIDLQCEGLDLLLLSLLNNQFESFINITSVKYASWIDAITTGLSQYFQRGLGDEEVIAMAQDLRKECYDNGNDRELLITDIINAVIEKRIGNSAWKALPRYSGIDEARWYAVIQKRSFIKEFWPAQILLGEKGVFNGHSAVVQMPTSAGKTKSIEIIIRSAFLSGRANMAIIVAPFKALCTEIKLTMERAFYGEDVDIDAPTDAFQVDFAELDDLNFETRNLILIATPEKLMYILRHAPELAQRAGVLIFDEGHQFDSGLRGVTYELLLSSLKSMVIPEIQTVLISAVISNGDAIGSWLNGDSGELVSGINLTPTYRTIAFVSWPDKQRGILEFVEPLNIDNREYFVPRVIEQIQLEKRGKERNERFFPEKTSGQQIALYLGIKLVQNGAIAIFCGTKQSVIGMCEIIVDLYRRNYPVKPPAFHSDDVEVGKLRFLHELHFGNDYTTTESAALGVFAHSASVPQGIRVAIEYAMQTGKARFVICTSTLAQGVNLPIRYLIVTSVYQAGQKIKTRDFHNLIGRAGRSGMHTEGSILFADPDVYDKRFFSKEKWRWGQVKNLLDPGNSEPCASTLASLFDSLDSEDRESYLSIDAPNFVREYLANNKNNEGFLLELAQTYSSINYNRDNVIRFFQTKIKIIAAIESYLMSYWEGTEIKEEDASNLAKGTLAYHLSNDQKRTEIVEIFELLATNVTTNFADPVKRKVFGKTLFGVKDILEIQQWVDNSVEGLIMIETSEELLEKIWPLLLRKVTHDSFRKISPNSQLLPLAFSWIAGIPYFEMLKLIVTSGAVLIAGTQKRNIKQDVVVDICENAFSYDITLLIAALVETLNAREITGREYLIEQLNFLQKRIKYGLKSALAIAFYEIGFSDRLIAGELAETFSNFGIKRHELLFDIRRSVEELKNALFVYPEYYTNVLSTLTFGS